MNTPTKMNIPITKLYLGEEEVEAVREVLKSGWLVQGDKVEQFENMVKTLVKTKRAVACGNCTEALHMSVLALGIGRGDRVAVPAYTFVATPNAVEYVGGKVVFVDIDLETFNIDTDALDRHRRGADYVCAAIPVHLFGLCANMTKIMRWAKTEKVDIIEDAACALGASCPEGMAGAIGEIGCFSLHPRKSVTTGEGGMMTTNREDLARKVSALRDFGFEITDIERHRSGQTALPQVEMLGYNYRMCLPAGSKVLVSKNLKWKNQCGSGESTRVAPKAIETIKVGDKVLSFNEKTGKKELKRVTGTSTLVDNDLVRVKFANGNEVVATSNHPIYIHDKGWVKAGQVTIGDLALQYKYCSLGWRLCNLAKKGKKLEEIFGGERASSIKKEHGKKVHALRIDPMSKYNHSEIFLSPEMFSKRKETLKKLNQAGLLYPPERRTSIGLRTKMAWAAENSKLRDPIVLKRKGIAVSITKRRRMRSDPEFAAKVRARASQLIKSVGRKPTRIEMELTDLLREKLPDTYRYVGDGKFWLENANPDFINVNGYKKAIEVYTPYWKKRKYGSVEEYEKQRRTLFERYGWDVLFVRAERRIENHDALIKRIVDFTYNPNISAVAVVAKERIDGSHTVYNLDVEDNNNFFAYGILVHNTNIQGAIGVEQMKKYDYIVGERAKKAEIYNRELAGLDWIRTPVVPEGYKHTYQSYCLLVGEHISSVKAEKALDYIGHWSSTKDKLVASFKDKGISVRGGTHACHMLPYYVRKYNLNPVDFPNTMIADALLVTIPLFASMTDDEQQFIIDAIKELKP